MATRFLKSPNGGIYKDSNGKFIKVDLDGKLPLVVGTQRADNPYDITASDLDGVTAIGEYAFYYKSGLRSIDLSNATSIGSNAFYACNALTSIDLPNATSVGEQAFYACNALTSANMPKVTSLGNYAFEYCSALTSVDMPNVTSVGTSAFRNCQELTSVDMPKVTRVGNSAFRNCQKLTSVFIGSACTSIENFAFYGGASGFTVTIEATTPPTLGGSNAFNEVTNFKIIVPKGCGETYKTATNWSNFASYIEEATA